MREASITLHGRPAPGRSRSGTSGRAETPLPRPAAGVSKERRFGGARWRMRTRVPRAPADRRHRSAPGARAEQAASASSSHARAQAAASAGDASLFPAGRACRQRDSRAGCSRHVAVLELSADQSTDRRRFRLRSQPSGDLPQLSIIISGIAQGCICGLIALGLRADLLRRPRRSASRRATDDARRLLRTGADDAAELPFWLACCRRSPRWLFVSRHRRVVIRPSSGNGLLGRDADDRHRLRAARPHRCPTIGTETHVLGALQGPSWNLGAPGAQRRADGGDRRHRAAVCAALRAVPLQQARHRDAGLLAEPARRLLHGHSGAAPQRHGLGPRGGSGPRWPGCCSRPSPSCGQTWASSA